MNEVEVTAALLEHRWEITRIESETKLRKEQLLDLEEQKTIEEEKLPLRDMIFTMYDFEVDSALNVSLIPQPCLLLKAKEGLSSKQEYLFKNIVEAIGSFKGEFKICAPLNIAGYSFHLLHHNKKFYLAADTLTKAAEVTCLAVNKAKEAGAKVAITEESLQPYSQKVDKQIGKGLSEKNYIDIMRNMV